MVEVRITLALREQVFRIFKEQSYEIFDRFKSLEQQPQKGKAVGHVDNIVIKELKDGKYRFYFITDGHILKFGSPEEIAQLLIKFVRMSEKKDQPQIIAEVKRILQSMGFDGL